MSESRSFLKPSILVLLSALTVAACTADTGADEPRASTDAELAVSLANNAEVHSDHLVFSKSVLPDALRKRIMDFQTAIAAGRSRADVENVILVGDRAANAIDASGKVNEAAANPYGYIRRALSLRDEGDKTIVQTEQASLDEAFAEIKEGRFIEVGPQATANGLTPQFARQLQYTIPIINLDGQDVYRSGDTFVNIKRGYVNLNTTIDLGVDISWFRLTHAHARIDALVESELTVDAATAAAWNAAPQREIFAGRWPVGSIGPIPVTLGVSTTVGCEIATSGRANATAGVTASLSLKGGVDYDRGEGVRASGETPVFTPGYVQPVIDADGTANAKCYVRPSLSLLLFDVGGPTLTPQLHARLEASASTAEPLRATLYGGLSADIGGQLQVFGHDLGRFDHQIFSFEREIWSHQR